MTSQWSKHRKVQGNRNALKADALAHDKCERVKMLNHFKIGQSNRDNVIRVVCLVKHHQIGGIAVEVDGDGLLVFPVERREWQHRSALRRRGFHFDKKSICVAIVTGKDRVKLLHILCG